MDTGPEVEEDQATVTPEQKSTTIDLEEISMTLSSLSTSGGMETPRSRHQGQTRGRATSRGKVLFTAEKPAKRKRNELPEWSKEELRLSTSSLLQVTAGDRWVAHKFWNKAGRFIQKQLHTSYCRSGNFCLCFLQ